MWGQHFIYAIEGGVAFIAPIFTQFMIAEQRSQFYPSRPINMGSAGGY
jgi:hypothetical protein